MSSNNFPNRNLNQTAVYWGNPQNDGYGGFTYDTPVEISCRWEDSTKIITDSNGREIVSQAEVHVNQDVDEKGLLYLGTLDDLDSDEESDPITIASAFEIKRFDKIPNLKATAYYRKAYL